MTFQGKRLSRTRAQLSAGGTCKFACVLTLFCARFGTTRANLQLLRAAAVGVLVHPFSRAVFFSYPFSAFANGRIDRHIARLPSYTSSGAHSQVP